MRIMAGITIEEIMEKGGEKAKEILKKHLGKDILNRRDIFLAAIGQVARDADLTEEMFEKMKNELEEL
jgi:hypothetical protein